MKSSYLIIILFSLLCFSCTKDATVIRVPEACFYADKININRNDTVTFTNCSKADIVWLTVVKRNETHNFFYDAFDNTNIIFKVFNDSGLFDAVIQALDNTNGSPMKFQKIPITVK